MWSDTSEAAAPSFPHRSREEQTRQKEAQAASNLLENRHSTPNLTVPILGRHCRSRSQKEKRARNISRFSLFENCRHLCAQFLLIICQLSNKLRCRRGQKDVRLKGDEGKAFSALLHCILHERQTI